MAEVTLILQKQAKVGVSTLITHDMKKSSSHAILMTENLKIYSYFKLRGRQVIKDYKELDRVLDHIDRNDTLVIDSLGMLKEKEIKDLVSRLSVVPKSCKIYIVASIGSKYDSKKYILLLSCLNNMNVDFNEYDIDNSSGRVCVYKDGKPIRDITDIVKYGFTPLLQ